MSSKMIGKLNLNKALLQKDLDTIAQFPILEEEYAEFGIGSWKNHSLWNELGDYTNTQYTDYRGTIKITELGQQLPYLNQLIQENFDLTHLKMVRARNLVGGFVIPHKDFVEFNKNNTQYLRVFIPLENNPKSYHSDEHSVFQMQQGEVWRLDASIVHAAANFSNESRVHLCLDFQFQDVMPPLESIFLNPESALAVVEPTIPKRAKIENLDQKFKQLTQNIRINNLLETLVDLSKLHFEYEVNIIDCYDWLLNIARDSGSEDVLKKCLILKKYMIEERSLGERFSFQESH